MKKFLSIIVVTAMLCAFTACENNTADEVESSVTSVAEVSEETTEEITTEEKTTEETTEEITTEETTEKITEEETTEEITETKSENVTPENASEYREVLETFLEYTNSNDIENIMKITYPDEYIDVIKIIAENTSYLISEVMNYENDGGETVRLVEIISEESLNDDKVKAFHVFYGIFQIVKNYLDENGTNNFAEWIDNLDISNIENIPEPYFHADDIRMVNCLLEYTDSDGDSYTEERKFMLYYIDGEGWQVDIGISGYEKESKQQTLNSVASTIKKASNSAIVDFDDMDIEYPEKCIICSDKSKNYNVTDDFVSQFEEELEIFFPDYDKYDYIIVLNNDCCAYTACKDPEFPKYIGMHSNENGFSDIDGEYTFDEIYNICLEEIKK